MNKSNIIEKEEVSGNLVHLFIYRAHKKNHDAMVQLNKQCTEFFRKHGILRFEVLHLSGPDIVMDFVSRAETLSASQDGKVSGEKYNHTETTSTSMSLSKI